MGTAAAQLMPIAITGEYRADGAFRSLRTDISGARTAIGQWRGETARAANDMNASMSSIQQRINATTGVTARASTQSTAALLRQGQELDSMRAKYSPLFAVQQQYRQQLQEINAFTRAGALSETERAAALVRTKSAFASQVRAIKDTGTATARTSYMFSGLSFQLNDIVGGLAMGQSPFQIMAQQGGQVLQVLQMGPGGIGGSLQAIKGQIAGLLTPARAAILAFTAAAGAAYLLYNVFREKGPSAEESLEQHGKLLGIIKGAYQDAGKAAGQFFDTSKAITLLQTQQNLIALQNQLRGAAGSAVKSVTTPTSVASEIPLPPGTQAIENASVGATAFRDLNAAINDFNASARSASDVQSFRDIIASLGTAAAMSNPELAKTAAEILKNTAALGDLALATQKTEAMLRLMTGTATQADRQLLGMSIKPTASAYKQLIDRTKDHIETLKEEAKNAGQTGSALIGLKLQQDAVRAAKQDGIKVNQKVLDQLKQELILTTNLKAAAELGATIRFDRAKLGMNDNEASIADTLRSANIDAGSAQGEMLAGQLRVNQALTETRDLARGALSGFVNDLRQGKTAGEAFANVLNRIADKLIDMAVQDLVGNAFKGAGSGGGGGGISGIFSAITSVFGGFRAGGGPVQAGKAYVVGEKRPELFVPGTSGSIVPRIPQGGGSSSPTIVDSSTNHFNSTISGSDQNWVRATVRQAMEASEGRMMKVLADQRARRT